MKFEGRKMLEFLNYDGNGRMWLRGTSIYDDQGQLREKFTYNGDNSLRSKTVFKRNEAGQVIEFAEYSATGTLMEKVSSNYNEGKVHSYERNLYRPDGSLESTKISTSQIKHRRVLLIIPMDQLPPRPNESISK